MQFYQVMTQRENGKWYTTGTYHVRSWAEEAAAKLAAKGCLVKVEAKKSR